MNAAGAGEPLPIFDKQKIGPKAQIMCVSGFINILNLILHLRRLEVKASRSLTKKVRSY